MIPALAGFQRESPLGYFGYVSNHETHHENHTRRSETAGHLECLGTFHKLKLLQMKFLIEKKHATPDFRGDVKS